MGGGRIRLEAASTLTISGTVDASGKFGQMLGMAYSGVQYSSGGGSGGSIQLRASILAGAGTVKANGGNGVYGGTPYSSGGSFGGAGGGGARKVVSPSRRGATEAPWQRTPASAGR